VNGMKIAIVTTEIPEKIYTNNYNLIDLSIYLSENRHKVFLFIPNTRKKYIDQNVKFIESGFLNHEHFTFGSNFKSLIYTIDFIIGLLTKLFKIKPNIVLSNSTGYFLNLQSFSTLFFSKLLKIPHIQIWTGSDLLVNTGFPLNLLNKLILRITDLNQLQSKDMKRIAEKKNNRSNMIVIPSKGVNLNQFVKKNINTTEISNKNFVILYVGRYHPVKGIKYLINAFKRILEGRPDSILKIVGIKYDELVNFKKFRAISKNIICYGNVSHRKVHKLYYESDILVLPSLSEGLSNTLMEAMACGLPIVATNVGGNKELVKENKGGYLVPPKNSKILSEKILKLMKNPEKRKKMGEFNYKFIKKYDRYLVLRKREKLIKFLGDYYSNLIEK
jgi:glycosyltransferase involved in cell wall biosynthesis